MSEQDQSQRGEAKSQADQTLLGVAPPRIDSSAEMVHRAPVFVRSGTSVADVEPAPPSRATLPSEPARVAAGASQIPAAVSAQGGGASGASALSERVLEVARRRPVLWMVLTPLFVAAVTLALGRHGRPPRSAPAAGDALTAQRVDPAASGKSETGASASIAELEAKPAESLRARELVLLAEARSERQVLAARELRRKVEADPTLAQDNAVQSELLRLAADQRTARDALAAMAVLGPPVGADLLYETWTGTSERSDTTELARALVYSAEVRASASSALAVALDLRVAETCEQYKAILPQALKDGDRRALHLLTKLNAKRGCGPKKSADCFACLREPSDELTATINAVKSRRAPSYTAP